MHHYCIIIIALSLLHYHYCIFICYHSLFIFTSFYFVISFLTFKEFIHQFLSVEKATLHLLFISFVFQNWKKDSNLFYYSLILQIQFQTIFTLKLALILSQISTDIFLNNFFVFKHMINLFFSNFIVSFSKERTLNVEISVFKPRNFNA